MRKQELIEQLTSAKTLTSTVDIDKVIEMIKQLETPTTITGELGREIVDRIERCLDNNSNSFVNEDSAEFRLSYSGREIELENVEIDIDAIMEHVTAIMDEYVMFEEDDDEEEIDPLVQTMQHLVDEENKTK